MGVLRTALIAILTACIGFAAGYYLELQKVNDLQGQIQGLMTEMEKSTRALREQVSKAESQKDLFKLRILAAEARCDVMERNFGQAEGRMSAIEASIDKAFAPQGEQGIAARDSIKMSLEEIKEGLKKLDVKIKSKVEDLGKMMDQALEK